MAKQIKAETWGYDGRGTVSLETESDGLGVLRKVHDQYVKKAEEMSQKACGDHKEQILNSAGYYLNAAQSVQCLIEQLS